jgi:alkylhydroperoxidase family enzyme
MDKTVPSYRKRCSPLSGLASGFGSGVPGVFALVTMADAKVSRQYPECSHMTTPRVPPLPLDEAKAAADEAAVPDYMAELSIFQVLLNHPQLARAVNDLLATMLWHGDLDPRLRELVIMRIAWLTACDYEWTQHWRVASRLGVTADDLLGVRDWPGYDGFGSTERAVLAATDDVVRDGAVSADSWAACEREFHCEKTVLIELVTAIGAWRMVASVLQSLQVPLEEGVSGWPPDGCPP